MSKGKVEIERKFLVDPAKLPVPLAPLRATPLSQGYLSRDPWVRIRLVGDKSAVLTIKGMGDVVRPEYEYDIPREDAEQMLATMCKAVLTKVRYELAHGAHLWVVDQFGGALAGLWLAEIELTSEDEQFEIPVWAVEDVSSRVEYTNARLAENGLPG